MNKLFLILSLFLVLPTFAFAQENSTTFAWDASTSAPLDVYGNGGGYRLYASKQCGSYDASKIVSTVADGILMTTIDSSSFHGKMCFVVDAFMIDADNTIISSNGYSNEVTAVYTPNPPGNAKKVANVALYPVKKAGSFLAGLFVDKNSNDENLRIID